MDVVKLNEYINPRKNDWWLEHLNFDRLYRACQVFMGPKRNQREYWLIGKNRPVFVPRHVFYNCFSFVHTEQETRKSIKQHKELAADLKQRYDAVIAKIQDLEKQCQNTSTQETIIY